MRRDQRHLVADGGGGTQFRAGRVSRNELITITEGGNASRCDGLVDPSLMFVDTVNKKR